MEEESFRGNAWGEEIKWKMSSFLLKKLPSFLSYFRDRNIFCLRHRIRRKMRKTETSIYSEKREMDFFFYQFGVFFRRNKIDDGISQRNKSKENSIFHPSIFLEHASKVKKLRFARFQLTLLFMLHRFTPSASFNQHIFERRNNLAQKQNWWRQLIFVSINISGENEMAQINDDYLWM